MPVDHFTRAQFEDAIPAPVWRHLGVVDGEHAYLIGPLPNGLHIHVRSSVDASGHSAECGEDSIRCWLVGPDADAPWGSKVSKWTTRVPGWPDRLANVLRELWKMALQCGRSCPQCGVQTPNKVFICRNGANKGRLFVKCANGETCRYFRWITDAPFPAHSKEQKQESVHG